MFILTSLNRNLFLIHHFFSLFFSQSAIVKASSLLSFMVSEPESMASTTLANITTSTNTNLPSPQITTQAPSPFLLLFNMSNLMSIKLDYTNYIPWRYQLITILEACSLVEHIDGSTSQPGQFLLDAQGHLTTNVNPEF